MPPLLIIALLNGDTNQVKKLLADGANVHRGNPLILACEREFSEIALALLETDIDVNQQDYSDKTPLLIACERNLFEVVKALITRNADLNLTRNSGVSPLMMACQMNSAKIVRELIAAKADLNLRDRLERTALMFDSTVTELLVEANAKLDLRDYRGNTALTLACARGNTSLVRSLITHGANIHLCNYTKETALSLASNPECAIELIKADHPYEYLETTDIRLQKALSFNFPQYPFRQMFTLYDISLLNTTNYRLVLTLLFCRKNNSNFLLLSNELFELILQHIL